MEVDASVQAFDMENDGKPPAKDFPATESHQAYDWHNSVVNVITDNKFKENCKRWKVNCPVPIAAFAQIIAETIFCKRAATRAGKSSPGGSQKLEQALKYFNPSQLLVKILHKDRG